MWKIVRPDALTVLSDEKCQRSLGRYFSVVEEKKLAKFKICRAVPVDFSVDDSTELLWESHGKAMVDYRKAQEIQDEIGKPRKCEALRFCSN